MDDFPDRESRPDVVDVVVIDLPHISNITDIDALRAESGVRVRVVRRLEDIGRPHVALLLGSKNVIVDLRHLYASGLAGALLRLAYDDAGVGIRVHGCGHLRRSANDGTGHCGPFGTGIRRSYRGAWTVAFEHAP